MKKDVDKLLSQTLSTYYFLLVIVFIMKLLGSKYFELALDDYAVNMICDFITKFRLENVWYCLTLYWNAYVMISITSNDNSCDIKKFNVFVLIIAFVLQLLKQTFNIPILFVIVDFIYLLLFSIIYMMTKKVKVKKHNISNFIILTILINIFQLISIFTRNIHITNDNNFIIYFILNIDFIIMISILHKWYFMKGGNSIWVEVVSSGSQKLISLKTSLRKLLNNYQKIKNSSKQEKITYVIYYPLYLLWNLFTMLVICLIAMLNDMFIEAIFITVAFWINKRVFGKAFHFKSVFTCFLVSTLIYYCLTRVTFQVGISFIIPIFLGVLLSYATAHLVKKHTKLYKGMSEEELRDVITQVTDDELVIKICKEFYCDRYSDVKIANINHYSVPSIRLKRQMVNKKLKDLNK